MKRYCLIWVWLVMCYSCVKDKPNPQDNSPVSLSKGKKIYVVNEGNFNSTNASVSVYDPLTAGVVEDIYKSQNNEILGDVAQSISYFNGKYYVVVNNSGKIMVCNSEFGKVGQISGLTSPRYLVQVTPQKAYVSDYKSNAITVVDLNQNAKYASINCPGWTEQMLMIYNKVFVCNKKRNYVYVINTMQDKIEDSIFVGTDAGSIQLDKNGKIWVLSSGDQQNNAPRLSRIDPINNQVENTFNFQISHLPDKLCINKTRDTLYYIDGDIYRMAITDAQVPTESLIKKGTRVFYGLGIDAASYSIYAADALDYVQKSQICIYNSKGVQTGSFKAGIISNGFYFE